MKVGSSPLFIGVGVAAFGGKNLTLSTGNPIGVGPSGWYGTNMSGVLGPGCSVGELAGRGIDMASGSGDSTETDSAGVETEGAGDWKPRLLASSNCTGELPVLVGALGDALRETILILGLGAGALGACGPEALAGLPSFSCPDLLTRVILTLFMPVVIWSRLAPSPRCSSDSETLIFGLSEDPEVARS